MSNQPLNLSIESDVLESGLEEAGLLDKNLMEDSTVGSQSMPHPLREPGGSLPRPFPSLPPTLTFTQVRIFTCLIVPKTLILF